jgi:hypothetical protein
MKHEGDIPVTIKCTIVSSGDTLAIRKKISGSACMSACESAVVGTNRLFVSSSNLENDRIQ